MTLLEALVALVILGLTSVAFLEAFQTTSRSMRDAEAWVQAVGYAEASVEETRLGNLAGDASSARSLPPGFARHIEVRPWPAAAGVEQVSATVTLPGGGSFVLHRLVRSP